MKATFILLAASVAEAFVIRGRQELSARGELPPYSQPPQLWKDETSFVPHLAEMAESIDWLLENHPHEAEILQLDQDFDLYNCGSDDGDDGRKEDSFILAQPQTRHAGGNREYHPDYGHFDMTLYEMINSSTHAKIFAEYISRFDDIVDLLQSTSSKLTVFVPTDEAFTEIKSQSNPADRLIKRAMLYHILPGEYSRKDLFSSRTMPTLLESADLGHYPQRIGTQFGPKGLTMNFRSSIIGSDLYGKNGVIHVLDNFLIPPAPATETLNTLPSTFSTFELGMYKTGLVDYINDHSTHVGSTLFVPTNQAFENLGREISGYLFSECGERYLEAILKYHIVCNHTLYSDAYNRPVKENGLNPESFHLNLPTLLPKSHITVDIAQMSRLVAFSVNGHSSVAIPDLLTQDGVIHVLNKILLPPCQRKVHTGDFLCEDPQSSDGEDAFNLTVEELIERLNPYVDS
ncbi:fasciclin domain family [Histoplasma capsulatum G186AR]|uniref:Fasciclin domain family n=2 Tax=Ajellomyces capsulatus TaxID=5037 RepID=C0NRJ7_AJECG|nr:fasciclin domain family [Histoplasma capsulatum G186AR]EEH06311.1 fasciclin domain family [Histoplasma capsulatum G186AR]KAG5293233.1 fasciclin domain family [Histoplasma capsulatum]QSS74683.1 fasciclin domain family [Histoplasma capsulatum G186AR]